MDGVIPSDHSNNNPHNHKKSTFIFLHLGQAGIQIGDAIWELYNLEHGFAPDGTICDPNCIDDETHNDAIYHETRRGKFVPSALMVDLEEDVIMEIKNGIYRNLFHPSNLICGQEDASNNFARGFYSVGKDISPRVHERVRKLSEQMDKIRGVVYTHSMGGGTGSGMTASSMLDVRENYSAKTLTYQFSIVPSQQLSAAVVEPYNALLHTHYTTSTDMNMMYDNESMYNICRTKLHIKNPSYAHINRLVAQTVSHVTLTERFSGTLNTDLSDLKTNLVPFPAIHFPILNMAPVVPPGFADIENLRITTLLRDLYSEDSLMVSCPNTIEENARLISHKYFCCALLFRGPFHAREIHDTLNSIRPSIPFFSWCTTGFRCGMCDYPVVVPPMCGMTAPARNIAMLSNTTAVSQVFRRLYEKYEQLFIQGAFLHWYEREGMPGEDWQESVETISQLLHIYNDYLFEDGAHVHVTSENNSEFENSTVIENADVFHHQ